MATPEKIFRNGMSMQQTGFSQEQSEALVRMIQNVVESVVSESLQPVIQRLNDLEAHTDARFQALEARMEAGFKEVDARFQEMDARFKEMDVRFQEVDARFQEINARLKETNVRINETNARIAEINARIDAMQGRLNMLAWMNPGLLLLMFFGFSGIILTLVAILLEL